MSGAPARLAAPVGADAGVRSAALRAPGRRPGSVPRVRPGSPRDFRLPVGRRDRARRGAGAKEPGPDPA